VTQADSTYADLLGGEVGTNLARFRVEIDPAQTCGAALGLELRVSYQGGGKILALPAVHTAMPAGALHSFSYSGAALAIPDNNPGGVVVMVPVSGSALLQNLTVTVDIRHTFISDLQVSLTAPWGDTILLADRRGKGGVNYAGVVFDDRSARAIATSPSPFSGSYRPEQPLGTFALRAPAGVWTLKVVDAMPFDRGTINGLTLTTELSSCTAAQYFYPWVEKNDSAAPLD
jgi:subtilisin-like proprotein convertase family protein